MEELEIWTGSVSGSTQIPWEQWLFALKGTEFPKLALILGILLSLLI